MSDEGAKASRRRRGGALERKLGDVAKGAVAGMCGGFVASVVMNQFQQLWQKITEGEERGHGAQSMQHGSPRGGAARELRESGSESADDDATERVASVVAEKVFDRRLTEGEKEAAGTVVHYAFGVGTGAIYGAAAELMPGAAAGAGLPLGAAVWLAADEGLVPALGLSKSPAEYPLSTHAYSLASHFVYGLTTELVRRFVRERL
ncbi:MAG: DUF1440 domain-containing protein [Acidobacteria bacterium]|nr:DUF1440 domain-containing protein [Acidobacteriota bacterium]